MSRFSGSASGGNPKSNQQVRRDWSPARHSSSFRLKNVLSAVPSVEVIHSCGCTPVACNRVAMVGTKPSRIMLPVSSLRLNASSKVTLSPCTPWPDTFVTDLGMMMEPLRNGWASLPRPMYGLPVMGASGEACKVFRNFLKWSPASLPVWAR